MTGELIRSYKPEFMPEDGTTILPRFKYRSREPVHASSFLNDAELSRDGAAHSKQERQGDRYEERY